LKKETEQYESLRKTTVTICKGDKIRVVKGELMNIKGIVLEIRGKIA